MYVINVKIIQIIYSWWIKQNIIQQQMGICSVIINTEKNEKLTLIKFYNVVSNYDTNENNHCTIFSCVYFPNVSHKYHFVNETRDFRWYKDNYPKQWSVLNYDANESYSQLSNSVKILH